MGSATPMAQRNSQSTAKVPTETIVQPILGRKLRKPSGKDLQSDAAGSKMLPAVDARLEADRAAGMELAMVTPPYI